LYQETATCFFGACLKAIGIIELLSQKERQSQEEHKRKGVKSKAPPKHKPEMCVVRA
jgi:hypothetical protein